MKPWVTARTFVPEDRVDAVLDDLKTTFSGRIVVPAIRHALAIRFRSAEDTAQFRIGLAGNPDVEMVSSDAALWYHGTHVDRVDAIAYLHKCCTDALWRPGVVLIVAFKHKRDQRRFLERYG